MSGENIKELVKVRYAQAALRETTGGGSCCGTAHALEGCRDPTDFGRSGFPGHKFTDMLLDLVPDPAERS